MTTPNFARRRIVASFSYATGFDGKGPRVKATLPRLRITAHVTIAGGISLGQLDLRAYGVNLALMNQLSTLGVPLAAVRDNTVTLEAGDDENGMAKIYEGTVYSAWADLNAAPEVAFEVTAHAALLQKMAPAPPLSSNGPLDVATAMEQLAKQMGLTFENNGVSGVKLSNHYAPGTAVDQMQDILRAVPTQVDGIIDNGKLAIWPKNGSRTGVPVQINKDTGMVGSPSYTANGLLVRTLFNPDIRFGALVEVRSSILPTSKEGTVNAIGKTNLPVGGRWKVVSLAHDLSAEYPGGPWFTEMQLVAPGFLGVPR